MTDLPAGWRSAPLGEVCTIVGGGTPKTALAEYWGGAIPWITPADMSADRSQVLFGGARTLTAAGLAASAARVVPTGSVVVSSRAPVGYVAIAGTELATNQGCKTAVPPESIDSRYLYWYLLAARPDLEARASGTTFKEISAKEFGRTLLRWPSLDGQRRIVEILEDHLSRLDAANDYLAASTRRVRVYSAAALSAIATPDDPVGTLASVAVESRYGTSTKCVRGGSGVPVVRIPNLRAGAIDLADEKRASGTEDLSALMLEAGDLLIVRTNGSKDLIGRTAVVQPGVEAAFASYLIRYRVDRTRALPEWVHLMLERPEGRRALESLAASSAGQYNLGLKKLDGVELPLPSIDEQRERIETHGQLAERASRLAPALEGSRNRSSALRGALLAAAFSGRLTGRSSDLDIAEEMALA